MYSSRQLAQKYLHYYLTAYNGKGHGMHSPFVFQFILQVLNNRSGYFPPSEIDILRKRLKNDNRVLQVEDFGAGSRVAQHKERKVSELARHAIKPKKYAELLFRLVKFYKPANMLELGTSLGVTTACLASGHTPANIVTIEGSKAIAGVAKENLSGMGLHHVQQLVGNFDNLLPEAINNLSSIDLVYLDGNHRYEPTVRYFHQLLPSLHNNSVLVFDDIHWSAEMENAWREIKQHPAVQCTVDIFFLGFVFLRKEFKAKQHFTIRF